MAAAASIISQVAEGLEYAHAKGIIHRDVKPGNVLVSPDGEAKLSDLGLAGPLSGALETDPRYGKIVGTADYLSPDQIRDPWNPTPAWDIYSLGCTLYYAVTGKVPFPGRHDGGQGPGPLRVAAAGPAAVESQSQRGIRRGHGRHDGQGSCQTDCFGAGSRARLQPFLPNAVAAATAEDGPAPSETPRTLVSIPNQLQIILTAAAVIVVGLLLFIVAVRLLKWLIWLAW